MHGEDSIKWSDKVKHREDKENKGNMQGWKGDQ
jgi:hypothetical protein